MTTSIMGATALPSPKMGTGQGASTLAETSNPAQEFVLWLFDLGPNGWTEMNTDINGQNNGFNGWRLANDVTGIAYVDFTTGHERCQT
jgi:hypothetical protein